MAMNIDSILLTLGVSDKLADLTSGRNLWVFMALSYYRTVRTTAKGRWFGRTLKQISSEFSVGAVPEGDPNHVVVNGDIIVYKVHIHEPSVPNFDPLSSIIFENDRIVVFNKPSGIPVHPAVNYHQNTMTEILKSRYGPIFPCYRLDRLTSGVTIFAKDSAFASYFHKSERRKIYFARVKRSCLPKQLLASNKMDISRPIISFNGKRGFQAFLRDHANAKPAETRVRLMDPKETGLPDNPELAMLSIEPITGRTHQIRKHLALEGMPIHNDVLYNDGGRFKALCEIPSEEHFKAVWDFAERAREAKLTGENCGECGTPIYATNLNTLDLHCSMYSFDGQRYEAPAAF